MRCVHPAGRDGVQITQILCFESVFLSLASIELGTVACTVY